MHEEGKMRVDFVVSRRKTSRFVISVVVCVALAVSMIAVCADPSFAASKMKVTSSGIKGGNIASEYCYTNASGNPVTKSMPLKIENAPSTAKYYAVYMYDTASVAKGFVHWTAANYKSTTFSADASKKKAKSMVQGKNDFGFNGYGAPTPPPGTGTHTYVIEVYALKDKVNLKNGFSYSAFKTAIKGKVVAKASIKGKCKP
jgi:Raf kinase inhibitor-like YbhB/YbcL family protein